MNGVRFALLCAVLSSALPSYGQSATTAPANAGAPLRLVRTMEMPATVRGNFDHFGVDVKRHRLFATPEDFKAILVFDLDSGKLLRQIDGVVRPHAVLYRADVDRLYVTDGGDGSVKVYDGASLKQVARIALLKDADSIGYDISRKYLYVDNGGGDVGQTYSMLSAIDTTSDRKLSDMRIEGDTLEAMSLDNYRPHIYVNDKATNQVIVVDRFRNKILAKWPITMGKQNVAMALDEQRQRLFIGCRSGQIVVLDSNTGKELQTLRVGQGVDDLIFDPATRRLYASTDGAVDVFEQIDLDHYVSRGSVASGPHGRTSRLAPELNSLFVAVPQSGEQNARVLVYEPIDTPAPRPPLDDVKEPVHAPAAQKIALETLSNHPLLRRIGLHVIPPGGKDMILVANGNATRVGIHTSEGDFAAVKNGKTYGPRIADGEFYNMKMPMFDAQGRRIGILVMEIACTDAASEQDAAHQAESIRAEVEQKIPNLESLFAPTPGN
jgi:hypothetical protein